MPDSIDATEGREVETDSAEPGTPMSDEQYAIQRLEQATSGIRLRDWTPTDQPALLPPTIELPAEEQTDDRAAA